MNTARLPTVEVIQGSGSQETGKPPYWRRWKVFLGVLLISTLVGLLIVYGRDPLYRASVSVLTVKPKAVDARSEAADIEHVAIQGRLLLGEELLGRLVIVLRSAGYAEVADRETLRFMLAAVPIPETNLLELRSEGDDPELLQKIANKWAESYEKFRVEEIQAATGRSTAELQEQQEQLQIKIDTVRGELQVFRAANDIVSLERGENRNLSRLKGLNDSLNKARERLVEAQAKYAAIQEAVAKGETVVPREYKAELAKKQLEVERMKDRITELNLRYTQRYIDRDPDLKVLPDELRDMQQDLERAIQLGQRTVIDEARQEVEAAKATVDSLETELADHQKKVQVFTDRFKEFKSMEERLARLENLHSDIGERLARIQVQNMKKYPPIQVVEWASIPTRPIYPDYERDLMIALGVAFALALFSTWLLEYLAGLSRVPENHSVGMRVYLNNTDQQLGAISAPNVLDHGLRTDLGLVHQPDPSQPAAKPEVSGSTTSLSELTVAEIRVLLESVDPVTAGYCALLLSGVSPQELSFVDADCIDQDARVISVPGRYSRSIEVGRGAWRFIHGLSKNPVELPMDHLIAELDANLAVTAADLGMENPVRVDTISVWYSYVTYLVRQGVRLAELSKQVGPLSHEMKLILANFSPHGVNRPLAEVDSVHPAMQE